MPNAKVPKQPFDRIGLSLSGGGYRAASFHLGAMFYLNRLQFKGNPLLENVKLISTVSGGTITGAIYALKKQQGASFDEIYRFILNKLHKLDLVKMAIEKLNPEEHWENQFKHKNLINAFAELYNKEFTQGATFEEFNEMKSHLEAVVFNSTEFNNGINFRFRSKGSGYFGNYLIRVPLKAAQEVKISDAMASSSCFTGGFEPMVWPHDFIYEGAENLQALAQQTQPLGLMDGGIYDNQGIESILNYKKGDDPYFDLVIVSDVTSPYMKGYKPTEDKEKKGFRNNTIKGLKTKISKISLRIDTILIILTIVFALLPFFNGYANNAWTGFFLTCAFFCVATFVIKRIALEKMKNKARAILDSLYKKIPSFYRDKFSHLKIEEISIRRMEPLILNRINSLLTLILDVFLKIVRRLNYYKIYDDERYEYRRISNLIRELTEIDFNAKNGRRNEATANTDNYRRSSILKGDYGSVVGDKIKSVAETASSFGTTLWFTEDEQLGQMLDKLVATGQFTMCYNILAYLEAFVFEDNNGFYELDSATQTAIWKLFEQCKADWEKFKNEPLFLTHELVPGTSSEQSEAQTVSTLIIPSMHIIEKNYNSTKPCVWHWPVQVELAENDVFLLNQLRSSHWAHRFSDIRTENDPSRWVINNILLFTGTPTYVIKRLEERNYYDFDVIFILEDEGNIQADYEQVCQRIVSLTAANGVFIFSTGDARAWFNQFLEELSHNRNLPEALKATVNSGYFYYDTKLAEQTKLSYLIEGMKKGIVKLREAGTNFRFSSDVGYVFEGDPSQYRFDHESDEATQFVNGSREITNSFDPRIFNQNLDQPVIQHQSASPLEKLDKMLVDADITPKRDVRKMAPPDERSVENNSLPNNSNATATDKSIEQNRNLQGRISEAKENGDVVKNFLQPAKSYSLEIRIGHPDEEFIDASAPIAANEIFKDSDASEETLQIVFLPKLADAQRQTSELILPRRGNSSTIVFSFTTSQSSSYEAEIFAFHKNRLIQQAVLRATVKEREGNDSHDPIKMDVVFCVRQNLGNIKERPEFKTAIYIDNGDEKGTVLGFSEGKPLDLEFNTALVDMMKRMKDDIEQAVVKIDKTGAYQLRNVDNEALLRRLAFKGNSLFVNHLNNASLKGPIQIVTKRKEYPPIDFVYTLSPPTRDAGLCSGAEAALDAGKCAECFDKSLSPAPHICPFGFWTFSEVIERHYIKKNKEGAPDYCLQSEPSAGRNVLQILGNTVYASTSRLEAKEAGLRAKVFKALEENTLEIHEAKTWDNWSVLTEDENPDSLILLVHTEKDDLNDVDQLEIETDLLIQNYLDTKRIRSSKATNPPFIVVIGCNTTELDNYGFDISTQLMNNGAAIVLSNFTKIRGRQAGPVVMKLVQFLQDHAGEEVTLGEILLKLRQHLLAEGMMVSLALVAQGDADWKIKTIKKHV